jgi:hypothetical protein
MDVPDKQKNNKNFFLIGTMNRINKLPKPVKDRIDFIEFNLMSDPKVRNSIIRKNLTTKNNQIAVEVTDDFLNKELEEINTYCWRELERVSNEILIKSKLNDTNKSSIITSNKDSISQAISNYLRKKTKMQYDLEEETDEERQNRFHKENMKMHEKHFIQQQAIQFIMRQNDHNLSQEDYMRVICSLTDEQKEIFDEIFEKNRIKEEEKEKKTAAEKAKKNAENSLWNWFRFKQKSS